MQKLRLELDSLEVESFAVHAEDGELGTVRGNEFTQPVPTQPSTVLSSQATAASFATGSCLCCVF